MPDGRNGEKRVPDRPEPLLPVMVLWHVLFARKAQLLENQPPLIPAVPDLATYSRCGWLGIRWQVVAPGT